MAGYRTSSQELDVNPNRHFCSQASPVQGAEIPVGGDYSSPSSRRGPAWLKEGFGQLLAVSQPFLCHWASFPPGTKVLDGLVEPQVPAKQSRSEQGLHLLPSALEPGVRVCVLTHRTNQPEPLSSLVPVSGSQNELPQSQPCVHVLASGGCLTLAELGELVPGQIPTITSLLSPCLSSTLRGQGRS